MPPLKIKPKASPKPKAAATKAKTTRGAARTKPRIEGTDAQKTGGANQKTAQHRGVTVQPGIPIGANGLPLIEIIAQASELVPVAQYANVTVGPVAARRLIQDPGLSELAGVDLDDMTPEQAAIYDAFKEEVVVTQQIIEDVVAEDRENILESVRRQNEEEQNSSRSK